MDVKKLPGAGSKFRATYGPGSFARKLSSATRYGDNLGDNKTSILKVVKDSERKIRLGKFTRLDRVSALKKIQKLEGYKFSKQDKIDTKEILEYLSNKSESVVKAEKTAIKGEMALDEVVEDRLASTGLKRFSTAQSRPTTRFSRVNRDTSASEANGLLSGQPGLGRPGFASSLGGGKQSQGDRARLGLRYEQMRRLGGGEVARDMQKKTFAQLQAAGGPVTRPGRSARSAMPDQMPPVNQAPHPVNPLNPLNRF